MALLLHSLLYFFGFEDASARIHVYREEDAVGFPSNTCITLFEMSLGYAWMARDKPWCPPLSEAAWQLSHVLLHFGQNGTMTTSRAAIEAGGVSSG